MTPGQAHDTLRGYVLDRVGRSKERGSLEALAALDVLWQAAHETERLEAERKAALTALDHPELGVFAYTVVEGGRSELEVVVAELVSTRAEAYREIDRLRVKAGQLREALHFYANVSAVKDCLGGTVFLLPEFGDRARAALGSGAAGDAT